MDEIIRAVRDCPSGALSLAFTGGPEERDLADWHGRREPAIEITRDGPYRVTGRIALIGGGDDGEDGGGGGRRPGRRFLPRALRPLPVRPLPEQAVLQRNALVYRVHRSGARGRPRA